MWRFFSLIPTKYTIFWNMFKNRNVKKCHSLQEPDLKDCLLQDKKKSPANSLPGRLLTRCFIRKMFITGYLSFSFRNSVIFFSILFSTSLTSAFTNLSPVIFSNNSIYLSETSLTNSSVISGTCCPG